MSGKKAESDKITELNLFLSNFTNRLDSKGRVSIPASFRAILTRDGFGGVFVHPSVELETLDCGGNALLREIETLLSSFAPYSEERDAMAVALQGVSELLSVDAEGRVVLSESCKAHAGITTHATFVGMGQKFQIWEPQRFLEHREKATARMREIRKRLGARNVGEAAQTPWNGARE